MPVRLVGWERWEGGRENACVVMGSDVSEGMKAKYAESNGEDANKQF
jgi:hypothetical protein